MALSMEQMREVINLHINSFINEKNAEKRKRLIQRFEDIFGNGITDWKELVQDTMKQQGIDQSIVKEYANFINREKESGFECEIRKMTESDFSMVREILNNAFDLLLIAKDNETLKKFLTGYSFVACNGNDVLGVVLGYIMPGLMQDNLYIDSLAVAPCARGKGIAGRLIETIRSKAYRNGIYQMKLMTDRQLEAYKMYRHLGFQESKYVLMSKW